MLPNIHIFGIQGSGKDTQAARLAAHFGLVHLSSGQLFRQRIQAGDTVAQFIAHSLAAGQLVPDDLLFGLLVDALRAFPQPQGIAGAGLIRTLSQYRGFQERWAEFQLDQPFGIELQVSEEVARARATNRNRTDDTIETLSERFRLYHMETEPVIAELRSTGNLVSVNGEQGIEEISRELIELISKRFTRLHGPH